MMETNGHVTDTKKYVRRNAAQFSGGVFWLALTIRSIHKTYKTYKTYKTHKTGSIIAAGF